MLPRATRTLSWAIVGGSVALTPAPGQDALVAESERYAVSVLDEGTCCPRRLALAATDHAAGSTIRVSVEGRLEEVERLRLFGDRLVVEGELPYGGTALVIADLKSGRQEETIWTYEHAVSPSGRFIVYRSHYPRSIDPAGRRSIVLLYDLAHSAEENRGGERRAYPCANQGVPVFPEESAADLDPCLGEVADRHWVSPFLWSQDETRIAFFECTTDWLRCDLVLLLLSDAGRRPVTWRQRLDLRPFVRREGLYQFSGDPGDPVRLNVRSLAWKNSRTLTVDPQPESGLVSPIEIELP